MSLNVQVGSGSRSLRRGLNLSLGKTEPLTVFTQQNGKLSFAFNLWLPGGMLT